MSHDQQPRVRYQGHIPSSTTLSLDMRAEQIGSRAADDMRLSIRLAQIRIVTHMSNCTQIQLKAYLSLVSTGKRLISRASEVASAMVMRSTALS